jgi:hypothetical protein
LSEVGPAVTWSRLPSYEQWSATCDTVHALTQVLGKLSVALAPPQPQLQHAALRISARGWETAPLPAPNGSGALVAVLDLRSHEAVLEHSDGRRLGVPLTPERAVGSVTRDVIDAAARLGGPFAIRLHPQEVPWSFPLDEDEEHRTYDPEEVSRYFAAATQAALVLGAVRAPYRGRSSPVNAWWGTFDLAVSLYSGRPAEPPSSDFIMRNAGDAQQIEIGWWPGDRRYPRAAFFGFATPVPENFAGAGLSPPVARWEEGLGEYLVDWDDVVASSDPFGTAVAFGRSVLDHACRVCGWDPELASSAQGTTPPVH